MTSPILSTARRRLHRQTPCLPCLTLPAPQACSCSRSSRSYFTQTAPSSSASSALPTCCGPLKEGSRVDWRMRSQSRLKPAPPLPSEKLSDAATTAVRSRIRRLEPPEAGLKPGEPFYHETQAYQSRFLELIGHEQMAEETTLRQRIASRPVQRLVSEGYALTGLSAYWLDTNTFGRPVANFMLGPGIDLPEHKFGDGIAVLVSRIDPLKESPMEGSVVSTTSTRLRVAFPHRFDLDEVGVDGWRLDVGQSNYVYDRMRQAVTQLQLDPAQQASSDMHLESNKQTILRGTFLRDRLLKGFAPEEEGVHGHPALQAPDEEAYPAHGLDHPQSIQNSDSGAFSQDMRILSWARRYSVPGTPLRIDGDPVLDLNESQTRAVAMMVLEPLSLVQGPPGTGKTKTIIEAVRLLKTHFEVPHPILICTYTNVAVDHLVAGFSRAGLSPLRVGFGRKVHNDITSFTLEAKLASHALAPVLLEYKEKLEKQKAQIASLFKRRNELISTDSPRKSERLENMEGHLMQLEKSLTALNAKAFTLEDSITSSLVKNADVICTTCITSACAALKVADFPVVFLDEASMSTEPASLMPLMKGSQHVALIGDHKQLPPVIISREAQAKGFGISLFERLTEEGRTPSLMLNVQYRMHPEISRFPSSEFYNFSLRDGTVDLAGNVSPLLLPPHATGLHLSDDSADDSNTVRRSLPVVFLDHAGIESFKDRSRVNHHEAQIVCSLIEDLLLNNEIKGSDIGIIAPYVAQISLLKRLFNTDKRQKSRFKSVLGDTKCMELEEVEICTVDGFEGREKEVIIFSTVRNNPKGHIGFLADRRRLNVGLTRAKRGLFVVGSMQTLRSGVVSGEGASVRVGRGAEAWRRYAEFLTNQKAVVNLSGKRLQKMLYGNVPADTLIALAQQRRRQNGVSGYVTML